jgi:hypothetical protein
MEFEQTLKQGNRNFNKWAIITLFAVKVLVALCVWGLMNLDKF